MRQKWGQPEIFRWTRSVNNPNTSAGNSSITTTATLTGVTFDIPDILSGRPVTARMSAVTPAKRPEAPSTQQRVIYCAGRTTAISISVWRAFISRSALEGYSSLPLVFPVIQSDERK